MPLGLGHIWIVFLILVIVLIIFGPGRLPEVGGAIGKGIREFRKASSDLTDEIKRSVDTPASQSAPPQASQPAPPQVIQESKPADSSKPTDAQG